MHSLIDLRNLKEEIVMEIVSKTEGSKVTMEITDCTAAGKRAVSA